MTRRIVDTAREHLATDGAAGLSLRAVARDVGLVSSAVYRYVPSRDDLLTLLIIEAYDALGDAAEQQEAAVGRDDLTGRFRAIARAVRRWAFEHEHEYALIFGSPVPGYQAPQATIPPATRVPGLLIGVIRDAVAIGRVPTTLPAPSPAVLAEVAPLRAAFDADATPVPPELVVRGLVAWTYLFGAVSFDLFGHRHNVLAHERAIDGPFFEHEIDRMLDWVGLAEAAPAPVTVVEGRAW
jgi:AcrR family transcriptional regulator